MFQLKTISEQAPGALYNAEFLVKTKPFKQDGKVNTDYEVEVMVVVDSSNGW